MRGSAAGGFKGFKFDSVLRCVVICWEFFHRLFPVLFFWGGGTVTDLLEQ